MNKIYRGKEATNCDGNINGFSTFAHILTEDSKKIKDDCTFKELITKDFDANLNVDYSFQHRYRTRSIESFFEKELFFALIICLIAVLIYFDYREKFKSNDIYMYSTLEANGTITNHVNETFYEDSIYDYSVKLKARPQLSDADREKSMVANYSDFIS
jgi:hypothetical protein